MTTPTRKRNFPAQSNLNLPISPSPGKPNPNPNSVTCTSFLMGGQYYPGKDKHRLHLRRRTLWYRILWSSHIRRICSTILLVYLFIVYLANPALDATLRYGKFLSNPGTDADNVDTVDDHIHIKPLEMATRNGNQLISEMKHLRTEQANVHARTQFLSKILPQQWFQTFTFTKESESTEAESESEAEAELESSMEDQEINDKNEEHEQEQEQDPDPDPIADMENANAHDARTLYNKNYHKKHSNCPRGIQKTSTTLVIQTTFDRVLLMEQTCQRWKSDIVLVIYVTQKELSSSNEWDNVTKHMMDLCRGGGKQGEQQERLKIVQYVAKSEKERHYTYPINKLRNLGLDQVTSTHVLVLDIDLIPSMNLDEKIGHAVSLATEARADDDGNAGLDPKDAIVVPAFERKVSTPCASIQDCQLLIKDDPDFIPANVSTLKKCMEHKDCIVFQSDNNWEGHFDTQSEDWLKKDDEYADSLKIIQCFHSQRYEPYVVIPWCPLEANAIRQLALSGPRSPYYDERFYGYGKNKIQQIAHLRERGYKFAVMPNTGFVMHYPHPESVTKEVWKDRKNHDLHKKMDQLYPQYLQELHETYENYVVETPICQKQRKRKKGD